MSECKKLAAVIEQKLRLLDKPGSTDFSSQTVSLLLKYVWAGEWSTPRELVDLLRHEGARLSAAQPAETGVGNMVRRVLKFVREEYVSLAQTYADEHPTVEAPSGLTWPGEFKGTQYFKRFQEDIADSIHELQVELEAGSENIARQSSDHIHANEVILTADCSRTVETFLKKAAKGRKFQVIVAETAPDLQGHHQARRLAASGIETTLITDAAVFAVMSRVNKVIVGTHTVLANGGLKATNGFRGIALAAKHHHVPMIVCTSLLRLSPQFYTTSDQPGFNRYLTPEAVLSSANSDLPEHTHIVNPALDYVPPELVELFITNIGGIAPSYVYRQLQELYHPDDYDLE